MKTGILAFLVLAALAVPASAQQPAGPSTDLSKIEGGSYTLDRGHARIIFSYTHLGFSTSYGMFTDFTGKLNFDPKAPAKSSLTVTVNLNGIDTTVAKLDEHLKSSAFFDVAQFPTATFTTTAIKVTGLASGTITGDLTLHGVTKPVTLDATFNGGAVHPMLKVSDLGFNASGHVKRSDFGMNGFVPMVGDDVTLTISAEFLHDK